MYHKIIFAGTILSLVGLGLVFHHFSHTSDLFKKYQKLGLVQSDIQYEKVEKAWGDQGLIFYQVQFPFIDVPVQADKMNLSLADSGMHLKLKNAKVKVSESLKKMYGSDMAQKLNNYVPYQDFATKLLTSLSTMGIDEFVGDISVNTLYGDAKTMKFDIQMSQEDQPTLQMQGVIHVPIVGAHQISDLWNGRVDFAEIKVQDSLLNRYTNYAKSRHFNLSDSVKKEFLKIKGKLNSLPSLKSLLR